MHRFCENLFFSLNILFWTVELAFSCNFTLLTGGQSTGRGRQKIDWYNFQHIYNWTFRKSNVTFPSRCKKVHNTVPQTWHWQTLGVKASTGVGNLGRHLALCFHCAERDVAFLQDFSWRKVPATRVPRDVLILWQRSLQQANTEGSPFPLCLLWVFICSLMPPKPAELQPCGYVPAPPPFPLAHVWLGGWMTGDAVSWARGEPINRCLHRCKGGRAGSMARCSLPQQPARTSSR